MRMILILVALFAGGFWLWGKAKNALGFVEETREGVVELVEKEKGQKEPEKESPAKTAEWSIGPGSWAGSSGKEKEVPKVSRLVRLKYRPMPGQELVGQLTSLGLVAVIDNVARTIYLQGPVDVVNNLADALAQSDTVPGSCGLQTWAVYVSKSAVKGFDLQAALLAVAGHDRVTADLGGGGVSLSLGADRIAAALDVMADGQAVEVVQRPHVRLIDGATATVEAIDEIPVPSTTVSQGLAQTSIEYRKVGLQLRVEPQFLEADRVRLKVHQQNGILGQSVEIDGNTVPIVQSQSVESSLEMTVGESVVFGGVRTYRRTKKRGLLRNVEEVEEGALYLILSTYTDVPRAIELRPAVEYPAGQDWIPGPGLPFAEDPADWIDGMLLPPMTPEAEERAFLRDHARKRRAGHPAGK